MFACFQPISWVAKISGFLNIILGHHPTSPVRPEASYTDHGPLRLIKELPAGPEKKNLLVEDPHSSKMVHIWVVYNPELIINMALLEHLGTTKTVESMMIFGSPNLDGGRG